jgi:cytochrome b involved in lipid metabolism
MNKTIVTIVILVVVIVGGVMILNRTNKDVGPTTPPVGNVSSSTDQTSGGSTSVKTYTLAEVAKHKDATSCYSAINGNVYDLTNWINQHPGGPDKILSICGSDGSAAFNNQHGDAKRQADILATFKIGTLTQ